MQAFGRSTDRPISIEDLSQASQSMWQEGHIKNLMSRFFSQIDLLFGLKSCSVYYLPIGSKTPIREEQTFGEHSAASTPENQSWLFRQFEWQRGEEVLDPIVFHSHSGLFSLYLNHPEDGERLILWQQVRQPGPEIEYLSRVFLNEYQWYCKLDKTKAMLYVDDLTDLYNYRYLDVALESELKRANRFMSTFSLLFIDLDSFKAVNDTHGHLVGSDVLRQVANLLKKELREVDTLIRYGGDEFIALLIGAESQAAFAVADRIRKNLSLHQFLKEGRPLIKITCSIGIASYPEHAWDKHSLIRIADETMYKGKHSGKNCVMIVANGNKAPVASKL